MTDEFVTVKEIAQLWSITPRRVQVMCVSGMIEGAKKFGSNWAIPKDARKPEDHRKRVYKNQRI